MSEATYAPAGDAPSAGDDAELCNELRLMPAFANMHIAQRAADRIESLQAERDAARELRDRFATEADRAEYALASAREDAERYRWLRQFPTDTQQFGRRYWAEELDARIDAAMAGAKTGEGK